MARLIVDTAGGTYPVHIGRGAMKELRRTMARLEPTGAVVIADASVRPVAQTVAKHLKAARVKSSVLVVKGGERSKSLVSLGKVLAFLERQRIDRGGVLVAVGGGTIGDLAGLAAATWLRGIRYVEVPTTLLAMVDSSIGGKTGVNGVRMKNAIGSFWQPSAVISDLACLDTLPRNRYREAFAEVVKYAVAMDHSLFDVLRRESARLTAGDQEALEDVISMCATAKALVVARDERDRGPRAILNYGHTAGHALEAASRYRIPHGRAVAFGMRVAARIAADLGLCSERLVDAQDELLTVYGLREEHPRVGLERMMAAIPTDKKARRGRVAWVLPRRIGHAVMGQDVPLRVVRRVVRRSIA